MNSCFSGQALFEGKQDHEQRLSFLPMMVSNRLQVMSQFLFDHGRKSVQQDTFDGGRLQVWKTQVLVAHAQVCSDNVSCAQLSPLRFGRSL